MGARLQQVVGRILADIGVLVDYNAPEEIFPDKWQCEYYFYQGANVVPVSFSDPTSVEQSTNVEFVKEVVNLVKNLDVSLRFGGEPAMFHLSPFLLNLL